MEKRKCMTIKEMEELSVMQTSFINKLIRFADTNDLDRDNVVESAMFSFNMTIGFGSFANYNIEKAKL